MLNKFFYLTFIALLNLSTIQPSFSQSNKNFSFHLNDSATTSAGVFKSDSTLIRTLWSGVRYGGGDHVEKWDGRTNNGDTAPADNYHVEVLSHNVHYDWSARIGNTSDSLTGNTKHRAQSAVCWMAQDTNIYYGTGYCEGFTSEFRTSTIHPQRRIGVGPNGGANQGTQFICTDGNYIYWAGFDAVQGNETFVFATHVSDNSFATFANGVPAVMEWGITYPSTISHRITIDPNESTLSGVAVQKNSNKLFVARNYVNELQVLDKTTGAVLQTLTIPGIRCISMDMLDNLWLSHGSVIEKYTVNSDGTITTTGVTLTGILLPAAIGVSTDNNTVAVADDDITKQVVRGFNSTAGGAAIWTLGVEGGYMTNSTVDNNKFYFRDVRTNYLTSIAFQTDGSFWVIDAGNSRIQHYAADRTFIDRVMWLPNNYVQRTDFNDSTRIFSNYWEFKRDYTKELDNGLNGSWSLVANWGANVTNEYNTFAQIKSQTTLSNGRIYGLLRSPGAGFLDVLIELIPNGSIRFTKVLLEPRQAIAKDGSLWSCPGGDPIGGVSSTYRYAPNGFDSDNDPLWSSIAELIVTTPVLADNDPHRADEFKDNITSTNKVIFFTADKYTAGNGQDMHLGAIKKYANKWLWKTSRGTTPGYSGDFPPDGGFDNFNGVLNAGGVSLVKDRNIFWSYHGEFWKQSQTNKWNHYWDNGLFVGQFGTVTSDFRGQEGVYGASGNTIKASVTQIGSVIYLHHNDESANSGVAEWTVTGLNTVAVQKINFSPVNYIPRSGIDLMAGLQTAGYLKNGNGWTLSDPVDSIFGVNGNYWYVPIGTRSYDPFLPTDVRVFYISNVAGNKSVKRDLQNSASLQSWNLKGTLSFPNNNPININTNYGAYLEILDNTDKIISRVYESFNSDYTLISFRANDKTLLQGATAQMGVYSEKDEPFSIAYSGSALTFKYMGYSQTTSVLIDPTANPARPAAMRIYCFSNGYGYGGGIAVKGLRFIDSSGLYYRSQASGNWNDTATWQSSVDNTVWTAATNTPTSLDNAITIRGSDTVTFTKSEAVDQLSIIDSATLRIAPKAAIFIKDGPGEDVIISNQGSMIIVSDSSGTGAIGESSGTITGNVTVENYIHAKTNQAYWLLTPSVNTLISIKPYIRDNWQEGQNNMIVNTNTNSVPKFGTHITGSSASNNGFDATINSLPSLYTYNQTNQQWVNAANTNATNLDAKTGYLIYIRGDRSINLNDTNSCSNTTLCATGKILIGTQNYSALEGNGRLSLLTNPYAAPINWNAASKDTTTTNFTDFENYYTYLDPIVGTSGGYVTVNATGIKSAGNNVASVEIQSGQAFFVKAKTGINSPTFTVKESHKSSSVIAGTYQGGSPAKFLTSLYFNDAEGNRIMADAVNAIFDGAYSNSVDGDDAEEIANWDENIAILRNGKHLSIEERSIIQGNDTLPLIIQNLKSRNYEWQFDPADFNQGNLKAYLFDNFLHTSTSISLTSVTVIPFSAGADLASSAQNRFNIYFGTPAPGGNKPPMVSLITPAANATYSVPAAITYIASASDPDGTIAKVEYYNGNTLLATSTSLPYQFTWANIGPGTYTLTAKATDNSNAATTSSPVTVTVVPPASGNVPPMVSLTIPAPSTSYATPAAITFVATASDQDGTIAKVEYYNGNTLLATSTNQPYQFTWANIGVGTYTLSAKATDNGNATTTSAAVTVTVTAPAPGNKAPTISLIAPAANASYTAPAAITYIATANDPDGSISKIEYYNGSTLLATSTSLPYQFTWAGIGVGTYTLSAKATDNGNASTVSNPVTVTVTLPGTSGAASASASGNKIAVNETITARVVYPGVSSNAFTISADKNIMQAEVIDIVGRVFQRIGRQQQGQRFIFGQQLAAGMYFVRIVYEDKTNKVFNIMKTK